MKVVLFCGGLGTRLRDYAESIPKPMVPIGYRPILWHLMKYYAHFGHREFILCLGYRGDVIKQYFLNYDECLSNDFVLSNGGRDLQLFSRDIDEWKITFVDTGLHANVGQRLRAVEHYVGDDEIFLANYADGLSDLSLPDYLEHFRQHARIASFLCVPPSQSFHVVSTNANGRVDDIRHVGRAGLWINGGFFAFTREIFGYLREGEELVEEPFQRLIAEGQLTAYRFTGFWQCMDTFKDKQLLDDMNARGNPPWEVWKHRSEPDSAHPAASTRAFPLASEVGATTSRPSAPGWVVSRR
jgi:glucose-1-phosphate cytidylyltransferase